LINDLQHLSTARLNAAITRTENTAEIMQDLLILLKAEKKRKEAQDQVLIMLNIVRPTLTYLLR